MTASRVSLAVPTEADRDEFLAAVERSRELHQPWIAAPSSADAYTRYLAKAEINNAIFVYRLRDSGELAGAININEIVGGLFHSGYLAYYAFVPHHRKGLMAEALALAIDRAFGELELHRLEANIQPENRASIALVRRLGFVKEGFSRRYLQINGEWRDHERWAILSEDWAS